MQRARQRQPLARFANTAGHQKFIRWATKGARPARVGLEATGIYSLEFALALHHAKNVEVMVVNPRAIKDFARACMQRAKTDAVDAGGILEYLQRMPFTAWQSNLQGGTAIAKQPVNDLYTGHSTVSSAIGRTQPTTH